LEGAVHSVATQKSLGAEGFVRLLAKAALKTGAVNPLYTGVITNLNILDKLTLSNYHAGTFMTANERQLGIEWPITVNSMEISVADARKLDVDKNLIWARLLDWDLLIFDLSSTLVQDLSPLLVWDLL